MSAAPHWELTLWLYGPEMGQNVLLGKVESSDRGVFSIFLGVFPSSKDEEGVEHREVRWTIALDTLRRGILEAIEKMRREERLGGSHHL